MRYVDSKQRPINGLPVEQTWQNHSAELTENRELRHADTMGHVVFPKRLAWSPLLLRLLIPLKSMLSSGVHASYGLSTWLIPQCEVMDSQTLATYTGNRLPEQSILKYVDRSGIRAALPAGAMTLPSECGSIEAQVQEASR
jgi:hypothetical protein